MPKLSQNVVTVTLIFYPSQKLVDFDHLKVILLSPFQPILLLRFFCEIFCFVVISSEFESDGDIGFDFFFQFL